jgi:hypothetical protein
MPLFRGEIVRSQRIWVERAPEFGSGEGLGCPEIFFHTVRRPDTRIEDMGLKAGYDTPAGYCWRILFRYSVWPVPVKTLWAKMLVTGHV